MHICHVSPHLPPDQAANALLPAALGAWSAEQGTRVSFVAHEPAQGVDRGIPLAGPVDWVPRRQEPSAVGRLLRVGAVRTARAVNAALDRTAVGADVLHLHSNGLIVEVASEWARRRAMPTVLTLYGTEIWHYQPRRPIDPFKRAYDRATAVAFYSRGLMDKAAELGLGRPETSVVYPAVSPVFQLQDDETRSRWRDALGLDADQLVLNVKRLHHLAGQDVLVEAFREVTRARPGVHLVICGTGPVRDALEAQARQAGLAGRVTFTGLLPNEEVARYAAVADVFALPSRLEALPTVAVEALAAGTPVVSADHPGGVELHALFGDDVQTVPRDDAPALARAIGGLLDQPRRTSPQTQQLVRQRFGPTAVCTAYSVLYEAAVNRP